MSADVVAQVKSELIAAGQNIDGVCGAFKICSTVAWRLRGDGWGLIHSSGNGCETHGDKFRGDTLMQPDGTVIDCLIKAESNEGLVYPQVGYETYNIPAWNPTGSQPPSNWRAPYDPGWLSAGGGGGGGELPPPNVDLAAAVRAVNEHTTDEADRVIRRIDEVRAEMEEWADDLKKLFLIMRSEARPTPPPTKNATTKKGKP